LVALGCALHSCERGAQWAIACALLRERLAEVDVACASSALSACEKAQQWAAALQLAEEAVAKRVAPNAIFCGALISACEWSRRWDLALQLLVGRFGLGSHFGRPGRLWVMPQAAAISCCSKGRSWEAALQLMSLTRPSSVSLAAAMEACSLGSAWQAAEELLLQRKRATRQEAGWVGLDALFLALEQCGQSARSTLLRRQFGNSASTETLAALAPAALDWHPPPPETLEHARRLPRKLPAFAVALVHARHFLVACGCVSHSWVH
ncbi:unnamed protein product, partial [Effrenium voratum]